MFLLIATVLAIVGRPTCAAEVKWAASPPTVTSRGAWRVTLENRSPDGFERPVILVNGIFGPTVEFVQGEEVEIEVFNDIPANYPTVSAGVTIHWHGLDMMNASSWYDGTSYVSQCPIFTGKSFTYRFVVNEMPGTYFWHAHIGTLHADGLVGPLIIRPPNGTKPMMQYNAERILMLGDWYHKENGALAMGLNRPFDAAKADNNTGKFTWVGNPQSVLINGKGCFQDCTVGANTTTCNVTDINVPANEGSGACSHEQISVMPNKTYLFRLINDGTLLYKTVCFESHPMTIVAADGVPVEPYTVECVSINLAQRYDVIIKTDQPPGQYWITALSQYRAKAPNGYAILRYTGTPRQLPVTPILQPGSVAPWTIEEGSKIQMSSALLNSKPPAGSVYAEASMTVPDPTVRVLVNLSQPLLQQTGQIRWALNNVVDLLTPPCESMQKMLLEDPSWLANHAMPESANNSPNFTQSNALGVQTGSGKEPGAVQVWVQRPGEVNGALVPVAGMHVVPIALGEVVEVVLQNNAANAFNGDYTGANRTAQEQHPFHLHGHHFWALGVGNGSYAGPEAAAPYLNTKNPPFRDTYTVLPNSYTVFRFIADNPGVWMLHCHIIWHQFMGQMMQFVVSPDQLAPPPSNMPECPTDCTYEAAPYTVSYVNATWGNSGYDLP